MRESAGACIARTRSRPTSKATGMSFLPDNFEPPKLLETERPRPIDVVKDYDAAMTSRERP